MNESDDAFEAAVFTMVALLSEPTENAIRFADDEGLEQLHAAMGEAIRNSFELWLGSPVALFFQRHGIAHPDDMSLVLLKGVRAALDGTSIHGVIAT